MEKNQKVVIITTIIIIISFLTLNIIFMNFSNNVNNITNSNYKITIILKRNGIYDTSDIKLLISEYLESIENDIGLKNIGISYFSDEKPDDLDEFLEDLYNNDDVRYCILVGRNLAWEEDGWKDIKDDIRTSFWHVNDELSYLEDREPDNLGQPTMGNEKKDIAISWIIAPDICDDEKTKNEINEIKKNYIKDIIITYTNYHNNFSDIINNFQNSCLYIYMDEALPSFYEQVFDNRYMMDWTLIMNEDYTETWYELKQKHLIFSYFVHGTKDKILMNYDESEEFTTIEQYNNSINENGLYSLFVEANACESDIVQKECNQLSPLINYCWPQVNICNGVWAYYSMSSKSCKAFSSTSPFLGHVLRNYDTQTVVIGDITSHIV